MRTVTWDIVLVILGLAFFLESMRPAVMPLGEEVGVQLPVLAGILASLRFGLILGIGAILAETTISIRRLLGSTLSP